MVDLSDRTEEVNLFKEHYVPWNQREILPGLTYDDRKVFSDKGLWLSKTYLVIRSFALHPLQTSGNLTERIKNEINHYFNREHNPYSNRN